MWDLILAAFIFACALVAIYHVSDRLIDVFLSWWDGR